MAHMSHLQPFRLGLCAAAAAVVFFITFCLLSTTCNNIYMYKCLIPPSLYSSSSFSNSSSLIPSPPFPCISSPINGGLIDPQFYWHPNLLRISHDSHSTVIPTLPSVAGRIQCQNSLCHEFLTKPGEKQAFSTCLQSAKKWMARLRTHMIDGSCHFMNGTGRLAVALASYPGSGNTWVRGLLEKASGICTGEFI